MEDSGELYRASVDEEDRISNLPVPLICHILSFLRTPTVVATSVLSKRWRFLWTEVTTLNFLLRAEEPVTTIGVQAAKVRKFEEFVNWVLLHIKSQGLQKFKLIWWDGSEEFAYPGYVLIWTSYAISRCVRELVIDLGLSEVPEGTQLLPGTLFTCSTLTVLKVRANFVLRVPSVVRLPKLEVLELVYLGYESNECINKLISCCPALHHLLIGIYDDTMLDYRVSSHSLRSFDIYSVAEDILVDVKIDIDAPNLECFGMLGVAAKECLVRGITSVDRAELGLDVLLDAESDDVIINGLYTGRCNSALKLVEAMNRAKFLELDDTVIKALSYATTPYSACFERLIELKVSIPCCHWSSLRVILGSTTKLRYLYITKVGCGKNTHRLCWDDPTKVPECLSSSLRKVSIVEFQGLEDEMEMIKYILQHGEVMELFTFKSASDLSDINKKVLLAKQISTFPKVSRACQIRFD